MPAVRRNHHLIECDAIVDIADILDHKARVGGISRSRARRQGIAAPEPDVTERLVARGDVGNGFDAARLQSPGEHQCIHADAGQSAAIDVDRMHAAACGDPNIPI